MHILKNYTLEITTILLVIIITALFLVLAQLYFNWKEIEILTSQAHEKNLDYSLEISNKYTGAYKFKIIENN
ncbi:MULTISPECIES: hypothetical protein [Staphylococcaceae]|uniref:hypothetical protein n=1 Tax=Staphylococcaceae TaxID=90964 RepID=UPI00165D7577|nr:MULTISPECIES: hypothetical protein [Macrococcus]MBC9874336.1 hypothetical protein [Macrococcus bohemicus]UTH16023.1 hypothetical protein KFV12_12245 [Macrococcus epidermidis]